MIEFSVLGSGSCGNCIYVESEQSSILIDAGFSGKEIAKRIESIGRSIEKLDAIFLTHEHNDHIQGAGVLSRRYDLPIYANEGTFKGADKRLKKLFKKETFVTGDRIQFKDLMIKPFCISHDTLDPVGYIISSGDVSLGCCTDTGKISHLMEHHLAGCNGLVLEFNHDPEMLKTGPYPPSLKQRVKSIHGHLANGDAARFLSQIVHEQLHHVVLAHLSETNNNPILALEEVRNCLGNVSAPKIYLAGQDNPTPLLAMRKNLLDS